MIRAYLKRKREERRKRRWQDGYNFAAGQMLGLGEVAIEKLLLPHVECSKDFGSFDEFDEGVMAAIAKYQEDFL